MSVVIQSNNTFNISDLTATYDTLPAGIYMLKLDPRTGEFFLTKKEMFKLPKKIYGDHSIINRWKTSFEENSEKNMGIILSGMKGTGKTITAQKFCVEMNLPVILIGDAYRGENFVDFLTNPALGRCVVFIDEFEKVYSGGKDGDSTDLLSLMDGNYPTKLIFLLTVNTFSINTYLVNRLNRIKYRKDYGDLDQDIVNEVIDDMLINKDHRESIFKFFEKVNMWTFDLLVNIIKEMNLFNQDAIECGKHLNLEVEGAHYQVTEIWGGVDYKCQDSQIFPGFDFDFYRDGNKGEHIPLGEPKEEKDAYGRIVYANSDLRGAEIEIDYNDAEIIKHSPISFTVKTKRGLEFKCKRRYNKNLVF